LGCTSPNSESLKLFGADNVCTTSRSISRAKRGLFELYFVAVGPWRLRYSSAHSNAALLHRLHHVSFLYNATSTTKPFASFTYLTHNSQGCNVRTRLAFYRSPSRVSLTAAPMSMFTIILLNILLGAPQIITARFPKSSLKRGLIILLALASQLMIDQF
jgi:hypothetical protein